ncbi:MAG: hypothetical protein ACK58T_11555, partial [Phycisphaerae bacterium]
ITPVPIFIDTAIFLIRSAFLNVQSSAISATQITVQFSEDCIFELSEGGRSHENNSRLLLPADVRGFSRILTVCFQT